MDHAPGRGPAPAAPSAGSPAGTPAGAGPGSPRRFALVVPVKPVGRAKSRLAPLGDAVRRALVEAFLADTVLAADAAATVARVLVVTDDVAVARAVRELGLDAVPDGEGGRLNASLRQGAAELLRRHPGLCPAALCADLPALRPGDLDDALAGAPTDRAAFVPDHAGIGTTLYTSPHLAGFEPLFGPGSRTAHQRAGALALPAAASLRTDVDTPADLDRARLLGLGARSPYVVGAMGLGGREA